MSQILMDNFFTLALAVGLSVFVLSSTSFEARINRCFIMLILVIVFLDIADMVDYRLSLFPSLNVVRYASSALGYTLRPATLAVVLAILFRRKSSNYALWIPIAIIFLLEATSYFTHLTFWFDVNNDFHRGVLCYIPHIISAVYMVVLIVSTIRMHKKMDLGEVLTIFYIAVLCGFSTYIESTQGAKFLLPAAMMVSCSLYYLFLYVQTYKRDALTELLNRRSFFLDAAKNAQTDFTVISIDMNGLKDINDTKGHQAGDVALRTIADTLVEISDKHDRVYRVGGDEFTVIVKSHNESDTLRFIQTAKAKLKESGYTASFGYAFYTANDNFDDVCNMADRNMYEDKNHYRHRVSN